MRILFIDDELDDNAQYYVNILRQAGHEVSTARTEAEARATITEKKTFMTRRWEVIILDMLLAKGENLEPRGSHILRFIRDTNRDARVVILSNLDPTTVEKILSDAGVHAGDSRILTKRKTKPSTLVAIVQALA